MKKALFLISLLFWGSQSLKANDLSSYKDSKFHFTASYPSGWKVQELADGAAFVSPSGTNVIVNGQFETSPVLHTIEQFKTGIVSQLKKNVDKIIEVSDGKIDGHDAYSIVFETVEDQKTYRIKQVGTLIGLAEYFVTYTTEAARFDESIAQAEQIISSVDLDEIFSESESQKKLAGNKLKNIPIDSIITILLTGGMGIYGFWLISSKTGMWSDKKIKRIRLVSIAALILSAIKLLLLIFLLIK